MAHYDWDVNLNEEITRNQELVSSFTNDLDDCQAFLESNNYPPCLRSAIQDKIYYLNTAIGEARSRISTCNNYLAEGKTYVHCQLI